MASILSKVTNNKPNGHLDQDNLPNAISKFCIKQNELTSDTERTNAHLNSRSNVNLQTA